MIPEIGILIAAYVITRMLALMYSPPTTPRGRTIVGAAAGVTIAIAVIVAGDLVRRGVEVSRLVEAFR